MHRRNTPASANSVVVAEVLGPESSAVGENEQLVPWQQVTLRAIDAAATARGAVRVRPFGSVVRGDIDEWSDLDALVVVPDGRVEEFWPDPGWLPDFGSDVAATKHWRAPNIGAAIQLLLVDSRHIDVMVVEDSRAEQSITSLADLRPVVDRSTVESLSNGLLLDATDVVKRAARGERLIATHLALSLFGRCLELAMVIRDIATGTCVHPRAAAEDALVDSLPAIPAAPRPGDLLGMVTAALDCFEAMLTRSPFGPAEFHREVVDRLIVRAQQVIES